MRWTWFIHFLEFIKRKDEEYPYNANYEQHLQLYKLYHKAAFYEHSYVRKEWLKRLLKYHKYTFFKTFLILIFACITLYFTIKNFYPTFIIVNKPEKSFFASISPDSVVNISNVINPHLKYYFDFIAASEVPIKNKDTIASYKIKCYDSSSTAIGRYQMNKGARKDIGLGEVSEEVFLNNPELQDIAMYMYVKKNYFYMKDFLSRYEGQTINGYYLTKSGMLSLAHALGASGAMQWIKNGCKPSELPKGAPYADRRLTQQRYKIDFK